MGYVPGHPSGGSDPVFDECRQVILLRSRGCTAREVT
jgi:hypothetical protein